VQGGCSREGGFQGAAGSKPASRQGSAGLKEASEGPSALMLASRRPHSHGSASSYQKAEPQLKATAPPKRHMAMAQRAQRPTPTPTTGTASSAAGAPARLLVHLLEDVLPPRLGLLQRLRHDGQRDPLHLHQPASAQPFQHF
jgi:hypothetical protein